MFLNFFGGCFELDRTPRAAFQRKRCRKVDFPCFGARLNTLRAENAAGGCITPKEPPGILSIKLCFHAANIIPVSLKAPYSDKLSGIIDNALFLQV